MPSVDDVPPASGTATVPLGLGEVIAGKYRVERILGAGGMGVVVMATHLELDQLVAIKTLREEALKSAGARARFAREAKAAVRLKGEHVARIIDVGTNESGAPFLVMEYLEGQDLGAVLEERSRGLPIDEGVAYLLQVCEAVAEAHGLGIVHRDLKPRNIFVTTGVDGKPLLKVLDFGISKIIPPAGTTVDIALTSTTEVMGSPGYMAPEQLRAARDADERSDIWSIGVMLYEIITGRLPWEASSLTELGAMVLRDDPRPMASHREDVPAGLDAIMLRCLQKEPRKRYPSVVELACALEPYALGLAVGSAERITSVARVSRQPLGSQPSLRERSGSGAPRALANGTSVSWGETELQRPKPSIAPRLLSRSGLGVAGVLALVAVAAGGYALARRGEKPSAAPPVLPEDRAAIRPPATVSAQVPSPPTTGVVVPAESARARVEASAATPLVAVPRRALAATVVVPPAPVPSGAAEKAPAPAKSPDAHDMSPIPRK